MSKLSIAAFFVSLVALGFSAWTHWQADARAAAAVKNRERELVEQYKPSMIQFCDELGLKETPRDAQTLDELFRPMKAVLSGISKK